MDPLAAILAVPASFKAVHDLIDKLATRGAKGDPDVQASIGAIQSNVEGIQRAFYEFTFVTVDLRPWKHAHHCSNLIIHSEMTALFKLTQHDILDQFKADPKRIELELEKGHFRDTSANYIRQFSGPDLKLDLPDGLKSITGERSWHQFIIYSRDELERCFQKKDGKAFCKTLKEYRDFVIPFNDAADRELLIGLQKISDRLDDIRRQLSPDLGLGTI